MPGSVFSALLQGLPRSPTARDSGAFSVSVQAAPRTQVTPAPGLAQEGARRGP